MSEILYAIRPNIRFHLHHASVASAQKRLKTGYTVSGVFYLCVFQTRPDP